VNWLKIWRDQRSIDQIPQARPVFQKRVLLQPSASDNPKCLWQTVNKLLHCKSSSPLPTTSPGTSRADSFASFFLGKISKLSVFLSPATQLGLHHLRTHPLLLPLPLISQFLFLLLNPKFTQSFPTVQTSNPIQIPSPYN